MPGKFRVQWQMAYSDDLAMLFVCTATDTWRYVALSEDPWP